MARTRRLGSAEQPSSGSALGSAGARRRAADARRRDARARGRRRDGCRALRSRCSRSTGIWSARGLRGRAGQIRRRAPAGGQVRIGPDHAHVSPPRPPAGRARAVRSAVCSRGDEGAVVAFGFLEQPPFERLGLAHRAPKGNVLSSVRMLRVSDDGCDLLCLDLPTAERLRMSRVDVEVAESAAGRARALSDPTRLMVATALSGADELCVCDLSWIVGRAQNLVSHHVRTLRTHGLVRSRRDGKMVMYSLTDQGRELLAAVLQPAPSAEQARV